MTLPLGELAALGAAACWAFTSLLFSFAGRQVGARVVNLARLLLAAAILILTHRLAVGVWLPLDAAPDRWAWLSLSGLIGLALGDAMLFQALIILGPRLGALMMSLAPIIATVAAWLFLQERLAWFDVVAIILAVGGVAWVVAERQPRALAPVTPQAASDLAVPAAGAQPARPAHSPSFLWGVVLGVGAAAGQALGLITSRLGMYDNYPVISATVIRILAAATFVWLAAVFTRRAVQPFRALAADRRAAVAIGLATLIGPVAGVSLSLVAIQHAPVGIASTLMALTPVLMLPLVRVIHHEHISPRALVGTLVALAGVALIFLA